MRDTEKINKKKEIGRKRQKVNYEGKRKTVKERGKEELTWPPMI